MSNTPPDQPGRPGGWLSNIPNPSPSPRSADEPGGDEILPSWDVSPSEIPMAIPVSDEPNGDIPMATPVETGPAPEAKPVNEAPDAPAEPELPSARPVVEAPAPTTIDCPACTTTNPISQEYCSDCGYYFSRADLEAARGGTPPPLLPVAAQSGVSGVRLNGRYELQELISEKLGVQRYRAIDHEVDGREVVVLRQLMPPPPAEPVAEESLPAAEPVPEANSTEGEELMPTIDEVLLDDSPFPSTVFPQTEVMPFLANWPSIGWERRLLHTLASDGLPEELDHFTDETYEYLVESVPTGTLLWDAWDDQDASYEQKFRYLADLAELLFNLHQCNVILEGLRPDIVVIDNGQVRISDIADLLPIPVPADAPIRGTLYTAPELLGTRGSVDARADLYGFGAMLYALHVGRELNERTDFDGPGKPKDFIPRFPDCHPAFGRLMMKTFRREVDARFPTDEAGREDATGFRELIRTLEVLGRTYDSVRLEIASWTSTGIVRTGNEDAFALLHATESRQDDLGEAALFILCDGMGGYEAGEVAAALTIQTLRKNLSKLRPFGAAAGESPFLSDPLTHVSGESHQPQPVNVEEVKQAIKAALREANKLVFQTSRAPGSKRRGMGCTAEVVYVDGRNVIVGHVGDSRTYHLHEGRLIQLTRDQTLVNRLVELGTLSPEEAETHPRKNELQQAIGGQPDVEPGLYHGKMTQGDWVLVCSDGLTNHVTAKDLQQMLQTEALSAEMAARRLVNLTLIEGATDNVTVVVARAT